MRIIDYDIVGPTQNSEHLRNRVRVFALAHWQPLGGPICIAHRCPVRGTLEQDWYQAIVRYEEEKKDGEG